MRLNIQDLCWQLKVKFPLFKIGGFSPILNMHHYLLVVVADLLLGYELQKGIRELLFLKAEVQVSVPEWPLQRNKTQVSQEVDRTGIVFFAEKLKGTRFFPPFVPKNK